MKQLKISLFGVCIVVSATSIGTVEVSAKEPREELPLECKWLSKRYDAALIECDLRECSEHDAGAEERSLSSKHNARCAVRYDELLAIADKCHLDPNSEKLFDVLLKTLDLWEAAYACMPDDAHALYLEEALDLIARETGSGDQHRRDDPAHLEQIEARREGILRIEPVVAPVEPPPTEPPRPEVSNTVIVNRPLLDLFTIRMSIGVGHLIALSQTAVYDPSEFSANVAVAGSVAAGARISLADAGFRFSGAKRHFVDLGLAYAALGGRLKLRRGPDEYALAGPGLRWVHHVGGFARYGFRIHAEHASLYIHAGAGLQVFAMGANFGTPFGQGGLGVCTLWEFICVDAGYVHGWPGALPKEQKNGFASAASITIGADLLRIPRLLRAR